MSHHKPTAAVIGISSLLGSSLVEELIKTGKYATPIRALGRNVFRYPENSDIRYIETDVFNSESVTKGLDGVEVVFDTLGMIDETEVVNGIAGSPSVKLVFPANYGSDHVNSSFSQVFHEALGLEKWHRHGDKFAIRQLRVGHFQQWWADHAEQSVKVDLDKGTAVITGTGNEELTFTHESDVAKSLAQLGYRPVEQIPEYSYIGGDIKTYNQVLELIEKASGKTITRTYIPKEEQLKKAKDSLASGDPAALMNVLMYIHLEPGVSKFEKYDNDSINPGLWQWKKLDTTIQKKFSK